MIMTSCGKDTRRATGDKGEGKDNNNKKMRVGNSRGNDHNSKIEQCLFVLLTDNYAMQDLIR